MHLRESRFTQFSWNYGSEYKYWYLLIVPRNKIVTLITRWYKIQITQGSYSVRLILPSPGSKEAERKEAIIEEATRKRIKVNFVLTGYCGENEMVDQALYAEIADATAGFVS